MKTTCPKCQHSYDIPIKTIVDWVVGSDKLRAAVQSALARYYRTKAKPHNMARTSEQASAAAKVRWDNEVSRSQNKTELSQPVKPQQKNSP